MAVADTQYDGVYDNIAGDPDFTDTQPIPLQRIHRLFQLETPSELALIPCDTGSRAARDALHSRFQEFDSAKFRNLAESNSRKRE